MGILPTTVGSVNFSGVVRFFAFTARIFFSANAISYNSHVA